MENSSYMLVETEKTVSYNERETYIREHFPEFGLMCLIYGIIYTFCMYKNYFGATFLIYTVTTVAVMVRFFSKIGSHIENETKIYFAAIILCGISTCITANGFVQFLNWCCVIGMLLLSIISQFYKEQKWSLSQYMKNIKKLFFSTIKYSFVGMKELRRNRGKGKLSNQKEIKLVITGVVAAIAVLLVILPLLISSDRVIYSMFEEALSVFQIDRIGENVESIIRLLLTFLLGFLLLYAFLYAACHSEFELEPERKAKYHSSITGITFTGIIAFVYLFYSVIQISYLFLKKGLPEGITYSEYAHEGFWQLLFVAFINIIMVLMCQYFFEENKWLRRILSIISLCTFVMIASAIRRMTLYIGVYHLTKLRVLVLWALAVLTLVMLGVFVRIYKNDFKFTKYVVFVVVSGYLVLSFARVDYWVAKYNVSHMEYISWSDFYYLTENLSLDATPAVFEINPEKLDKDNLTETEISDYYGYILEENENMSIREMNYSKWKAVEYAKKYLERKVVQGKGI